MCPCRKDFLRLEGCHVCPEPVLVHHVARPGPEEKKRCFPPLPQAMHAHCHAPTCKRVELWNNDTGKLLCRQDPICER